MNKALKENGKHGREVSDMANTEIRLTQMSTTSG